MPNINKKDFYLFLKISLISLCFVVFWIFTLLQASPLTKFLSLGAGLFCIGLYGVLTSKSILKTLISLEILFNSVNINLIAFSRFTDLTLVRGQVFSLFVMAVAAAEAGLGLALIIAIYRKKQITNLSELSELKG